jgi:glycogen(starch) synthase
VVISGRYEYRNKGVDMFIESLARLNHRMKSAGSDVTVVAFIIMPAQTTSLAVEALKGQAVIKSLHDTVGHIERNIGKKLFEKSLAWREGQPPPDDKDLLSAQDKVMLRHEAQHPASYRHTQHEQRRRGPHSQPDQTLPTFQPAL